MSGLPTSHNICSPVGGQSPRTHAWRIPSSKGGQVRTPGRTNRNTYSAPKLTHTHAHLTHSHPKCGILRPARLFSIYDKSPKAPHKWCYFCMQQMRTGHAHRGDRFLFAWKPGLSVLEATSILCALAVLYSPQPRLQASPKASAPPPTPPLHITAPPGCGMHATVSVWYGAHAVTSLEH